MIFNVISRASNTPRKCPHPMRKPPFVTIQTGTSVTCFWTQVGNLKFRFGEKFEFLNPTQNNYIDLVDKLKYSRDYDELAYYWTAWHDAMSAGKIP